MTIKANHPFKTMFEPVGAVDTPDPHTAVIRLSKPHPAILLCLAPPLCPIIPKHVYGDGQDVRTHPANSAPVGSGPFRFVEMKAGEYVILEKNPQFFIKGRPALDRVIFRFVKDPSGCMMAMSKGEAQLFPLVENTRNIARLEREAHLAVTSKGYEGIGAHNWLEFNLRKPELADVRVRKAVNYAIDRAFIINKLHGGLSTPSTGPLIPASPSMKRRWKPILSIRQGPRPARRGGLQARQGRRALRADPRLRARPARTAKDGRRVPQEPAPQGRHRRQAARLPRLVELGRARQQRHARHDPRHHLQLGRSISSARTAPACRATSARVWPTAT